MARQPSQVPIEVNISVVAFAFGISHVAWPSVFINPLSQNCLLRQAVQICGVTLFGKLVFPKEFHVWWRSALLGCTFSQSIFVALTSRTLWSFGIYTAVLSAFHYLEYAVTGKVEKAVISRVISAKRKFSFAGLTNPSNLGTDSFLLNHSTQYWIAATASWFEYFTELYFLPWTKNVRLITAIGLAICVGGDVLRKLAMFHAGRSFSHIVQSVKKDDHVLVTDGVFSLMRHPSYSGWFLWSVGTQILLANPVCVIAYAYISWAFFNERICVEEYTLLKFFGKDYNDYKEKVPSGIPFIKGYPSRFMPM